NYATRMATKSGFSSGWKAFVDHKWSKKAVGTSFPRLSSQTHYQEVESAAGCSQNCLNNIAACRQECLHEPTDLLVFGQLLKMEQDLFRYLAICTHIEYNCSRNEYDHWVGISSIRPDARSCTCVAVRPRRPIVLHAGNRARSRCECWRCSTRARKPHESGTNSAQVNRHPGFLSSESRDPNLFRNAGFDKQDYRNLQRPQFNITPPVETNCFCVRVWIGCTRTGNSTERCRSDGCRKGYAGRSPFSAVDSRERYRALNQPDCLLVSRIQVETCRRESFFDFRAERAEGIPPGR